MPYAIPYDVVAPPTYNCVELLNTVENDLYLAESIIEYRALQQRQYALLNIINNGIDFITLKQLNQTK